MSISKTNINSLWSSLLIEGLIGHGIDYFCVSPGSRSAPLAMAVANNPRAQSFVHFDERGAAFHAIGYVRATGKPAVLLCTSGTAVANYLPAIIEADSDLLPLIVLTADRPPELHGVGANQTIEQSGIFERFVRKSFDLPCPDRALSLETPLRTVDSAVKQAISNPMGPVHVNCMFREPLAPIPTGEDFENQLSAVMSLLNSGKPLKVGRSECNSVDPQQLEQAESILARAVNGIVILGHLTRDEDRISALSLAEHLQWPVYADITSGTRLGCSCTSVIPYLNLGLTSDKIKNSHRPDTVLHIGGRVVSKRLMQWIEETPLNGYLQLIDHPKIIDPIHKVTCRVESRITECCRHLMQSVAPTRSSEYLNQWRKVSDVIANMLCDTADSASSPVEASVARMISRETPPTSALFLASSMPIRDMDIFATADGPRLLVGSNRGASGIDGTVASACGFAVGLQQPVTLLIGDLALLHDLNSLAMLRNSIQPVTVVVINNNGGGIFDHLPIAKFGEQFERFFVASHGMTFEHAAKQFGLGYSHANSIGDLHEQYKHAVAGRQSSIFEVAVNRAENMRFHERLIQEIGASFNH